MSRIPPAPRKQRTRPHVIADLSIHHLEGVILRAGYVPYRPGSDYGYDLLMWTFDDEGFVEPGIVLFQVKAMESFKLAGTDCVFDIDVRDYNLWTREDMPVRLVLYDASRGRAVWLPIQRYFGSPTSRSPRKGAKTVRVRIPLRQAVGSRAVAAVRDLKRKPVGRLGVFKP